MCRSTWKCCRMYHRMYTGTFYHILTLYIFLNILWIKLQLSVPNFQINYIIFHQCKNQKLDPKWTLLSVQQKMRFKSLFWAHRQNHVISTPFLQACWKNYIINISMDTSTFPENKRPLLKKTSLPKRTENLQACILLEFHCQNLRKDSSRSAASAYNR